VAIAAAITLGQSPRDDILGEIRALVPQVEWIERGALDATDESKLAELAPQNGDFPIITRLRTGRTVLVGEAVIAPLVQKAADEAGRDAAILVVLCSGPLSIRASIPVLVPERILAATVQAVRPDAPVAIVTPVVEQITAQEARWRSFGIEPVVLPASPYAPADFTKVGVSARERGAGLIVLDCLGYSLNMKEAVARASGLPVILARSLVARMTAELLNLR
jgi:protein AroM